MTYRLASVRLARLLAALVVAACTTSDEPAASGWAGTIDTLPGGMVLVNNAAGGVWDSATTWRIREELRLGSMMDEGPEMFGQVADVAVDAGGRIYVAERQANEIRVFAPDGTHLRTIGREGGGPGEFRDPVAILMLPGRTEFWVVDYGNARYARFDTAGRQLATVRRPFSFRSYPWRGALDTAGRVMEQNIIHATAGRPQRDVLVRFDSAGAPADTVELPMFEPERFVLRNPAGMPIVSMSVPFTPNLNITIDPRGYIWSGISDRYRIAQQSFDGDTVRIVERQVEPRPVTGAEADEQFDSTVARMANAAGTRARMPDLDRSRLGTAHPFFGQLVIDDQHHLWVRPDAPPELAGRTFDVFDAEGRYLGRAESDFALNGWVPPYIAGDRIYAVVRDSLDVPYVVRARIEGRGTSPP